MLMQSESLNELATALSKAQSVFSKAIKDSNNPFFKSKYADLASVMDVIKVPMADNGLSIVNTMDFDPEHPEYTIIYTTLLHTSGQWLRGKNAMRPVKSDPQSVGSAITYARRYGIMAMLGIAAEDDDGAAASGTQTSVEKAVSTAKEVFSGAKDVEPPKATPSQLAEIEKLAGEMSVGLIKVLEFHKVGSMTELTKEQAKETIAMFKSRLKDK